MSHSPADPEPAQLVDTPDDNREWEHNEEGLGRRSRHTEDIAKRLKVSLAKVKTDIHRARAALATILERHGITAEQLEA